MARHVRTDEGHDPTRREFFRTFGRETVRNAGAVIGAASEIRRAGGAAARELLDIGTPVPSSAAPATERNTFESVADSFSSAYRVTPDGLVLLDQRDLPGRLSLLPAGAPSEIASAIRSAVVNGGPVLAEVAAYGLVATFDATAARPPYARDQAFRAATNTIRASRRDVQTLCHAVDRMEMAYERLTADMEVGDGERALEAAARGLRSEADAIAAEAATAHAALGRYGADVISAQADRSNTGEPIHLLVHADMGPLSCGLVGTGGSIIQLLAATGRRVHVWITEAAPSNEGSRLTAFQLRQLDIPNTVIADSAVGWLLSARPVDVVLLRGDRVAANTDAGALIGSLGVASLATSAGVPVYVCAPRSAFDAEASDGRAFSSDIRSSAEQLASSGGSSGAPRPAISGARLNPATDTVPAALISALITDEGIQAASEERG